MQPSLLLTQSSSDILIISFRLRSIFANNCLRLKNQVCNNFHFDNQLLKPKIEDMYYKDQDQFKHQLQKES